MRISLSVKEPFYNKIKLAASERGMGISEFIRYAVIRLLEKESE